MSANPAISPLLLTRRQTAEACGLSEKTIQNHTHPRGNLIPTNLGRSVRYRVEDVNNWIREHRSTPSAAPQEGGAK